jgi:predicted transcriptional regulator
MNAANLNHCLLRKHLERLLGCGFLVQVDGDVFELTKGGRAFLDEYTKFKRLESVLMLGSV